MARVSGQVTGRSFSTSSTESSKLYCAFSLRAPLQWFLAAPAAIWRRVVPWAFMCQHACMA